MGRSRAPHRVLGHRSGSRSRLLVRLVAVTALAASGLVAFAAPAPASTVLSGFSDQVVLSGLTNPTAVRFASDGRVFVAEKGGRIKVFAGLTSTTPTVVADLSTQVDDYWDRGLLGLALDPQFPTRPYLYVLYTYDARIGGTAPRWNDGCPTPPGPTTDGCVVSGRISKLTLSGNTATSEQVLVNDWCQQFPSHSVGTLMFGRDGKLYAGAGDGASFNNVDYGQYGNTYAGDQANPCGDPPGAAGTALTAPTAEGGSLRSQSVRRTDGPATLDGAIIRIDPDTGQGLADNPFGSSTDVNKRRVVAYGMRNPFRFTQRPGTDEIWAGDVGWNTWEEIDRVLAPASTSATNFGWPCYEGNGPQSGYQGAGLNLCASLYSAGSATAPYYTYNHGACVVSYTGCRTGGSSITGIAFYSGGAYPASYNGALFFADHSRNEIWVMMPGSNGLPDPANIRTVVGWDASAITGAGNPVALEVGPSGDIFYVDMDGGAVHRLVYTAANQPPTARATASPTSGSPPLTVSFDGTGSTDPEGHPLAYAWDLDGNGSVDSTSAKPTFTYQASGIYSARLTVTDDRGATDTTAVTITVGNTPPTAVFDSPSAGLTWKVGDTFPFSGHATDPQDGSLPATSLSWQFVIHHCASTDWVTNCHTHVEFTTGGAGGTYTTPDHSYPSYLEIRLTATDSGGLSTTTSLNLYPKTVALTFRTNPGGLKLTDLAVNASAQTTPFTTTVIVGSTNSISAPSPQVLNRTTYYWKSWSDGGAQGHAIIAPATATTYTATYRQK
jgi:glucose/arabinose dehydrogenase